MPKSSARPSPARSSPPERVKAILTELEKLGTKKRREEMATRYGIFADKAWGVAMSDMQKLAKRTGRDHELAEALWKTGWYEARMVASMVDDPKQVTPEQMDRWCRDFDNWAICDTVCFKLFDSVPHAFDKVRKWSASREEFTRRAGFALLACMSPEDERAAEKDFIACLPLIEKMATDERNFVKKAVNWALRAVGGRSRKLHTAATAMAQRLADSPDKTARWIGKDALKQLGSPATLKRVERHERA
ncbi:MAG TPA: DNA alkylation repair protein [Verrucomicrobiales bacterium]|nr:DNA alkylation repair protein [Verrucomicrobiales bacterium]